MIRLTRTEPPPRRNYANLSYASLLLAAIASVAFNPTGRIATELGRRTETSRHRNCAPRGSAR